MNNLTVLLISAIFRGFTIKIEPNDLRKGYVQITVTYNGMNYRQIVSERDFMDLYSVLSIMIGTLEYRSNETDD